MRIHQYSAFDSPNDILVSHLQIPSFDKQCTTYSKVAIL